MSLLFAPAPMTKAEEKAALTCRHCGASFQSALTGDLFCCAGCEFVFRLIQKNGLERFYDLQQGKGIPVGSSALQKRDWSWLEVLVNDAEKGRNEAILELGVQGISCLGCVWLIEKLFFRKAGALAVEVDAPLGRLTLKWKPGVFPVLSFAEELQSFGYLLGVLGRQDFTENKSLVIRLGLCGALAMNAMLFTLPGYLGLHSGYNQLFGRVMLVIATLSLFIGGSYFISRAWQSLRAGLLHVDFPISLGVVAAYLASIYAWIFHRADFVYFDFVSIFIFLMLVGRWVQQKTLIRNRNMVLDLQMESQFVNLSGPRQETIRKPISALLKDDLYQIAPGQMVPVRSRLVSGDGLFSLESINGESAPRLISEGQLIPSGAINIASKSIPATAIENWEDSVLAALVAQSSRSPFRNRFLQRFIQIYLLAVVAVAITGGTVWYASTHDLFRALQVVTSVLVVSCPCAAGVAIPMVEDLVISHLRKVGVFVRDSSLWPRLRKIRQIVFDKTGTLTLENMVLRNSEAIQQLNPEQRRILWNLVNESLHPVSCCLRQHLLQEAVESPQTIAAEEVVGWGMKLNHDGREWRLGRPGWRGNESQKIQSSDSNDCEFSCDGQFVARFAFEESLRNDAAGEIAAFQNSGYQVHILSGDRKSKVEVMARQLHLPAGQAIGGLLPDEKAERVRAIGSDTVLMIGDGANDSLAFDASLCSGTPAIDRSILHSKADFFFLGRGLNGVRAVFDEAEWRKTTLRRVITFSMSYNIGAISVCLAGWMSPLLASVVMPLSSIVSLSIVIWSHSRLAKSFHHQGTKGS